jgi:alpha-tubulin suppressor-like RCC1 family protein
VHVSHVALGERHCLALSADGRVWSWGSNEFGALGRSISADASSSAAASTAASDTSSTPHAIAALSPEALTAANGGASDAIVQIACSASTSFARSRAGKVFVWGAHDTMQLGVADAQMDALLPRALVLPSGDANAAASHVVQRLWVGRLNCVCETASGQRFGWGFHFGPRPRELLGLPRAPAADANAASTICVGGDSIMFCV